MELEGLKRGLEFLEHNGQQVEGIITDRHVQIKKFLREEHPEMQHTFDVWHVAKGSSNYIPVSYIPYSYRVTH